MPDLAKKHKRGKRKHGMLRKQKMHSVVRYNSASKPCYVAAGAGTATTAAPAAADTVVEVLPATTEVQFCETCQLLP